MHSKNMSVPALHSKLPAHKHTVKKGLPLTLQFKVTLHDTRPRDKIAAKFKGKANRCRASDTMSSQMALPLFDYKK